MFKRLTLSAALVGLCVAAPAMAQSYDFSTFSAEGQSYQNVAVGPMTLSSENGTLYYTNSYGGGLFDGSGASSDITMTFAQGMSSVAVRAGDLDAFGLIAYEFGTNNLLGSFYTPQFDGPNEPEWYTLTLSGIGNIGRIVFDRATQARARARLRVRAVSPSPTSTSPSPPCRSLRPTH